MTSSPIVCRRAGAIDRSKPLRFTFNGRSYGGYPGDTLASALLANGVTLVGRSFKYHRPRGIMSAGAEEPNALVQLGGGACTEPNIRATAGRALRGPGRRQPELLAVGRVRCRRRQQPAVAPVPGRLLLQDLHVAAEPVDDATSASSAARPASAWRRRRPIPIATTRLHAHCDVLVVGGGPAGLAAALAAGRSGARVILGDEQAGIRRRAARRARYQIDGQSAADWVADAAGRAGGHAGGAAAAAHHGLRLLRPQLCRAGRAQRRSPAAGPGASRSGSGSCAPSRWCWRPAPSSGRWCSPTTTGPASCWRRRRAPISTATPCCRASARSS